MKNFLLTLFAAISLLAIYFFIISGIYYLILFLLGNVAMFSWNTAFIIGIILWMFNIIIKTNKSKKQKS